MYESTTCSIPSCPSMMDLVVCKICISSVSTDHQVNFQETYQCLTAYTTTAYFPVLHVNAVSPAKRHLTTRASAARAPPTHRSSIRHACCVPSASVTAIAVIAKHASTLKSQTHRNNSARTAYAPARRISMAERYVVRPLVSTFPVHRERVWMGCSKGDG